MDLDGIAPLHEIHTSPGTVAWYLDSPLQIHLPTLKIPLAKLDIANQQVCTELLNAVLVMKKIKINVND